MDQYAKRIDASNGYSKIIYANPSKGSFYLNMGFKFMTSAMAFLKMNRLLSNQAL